MLTHSNVDILQVHQRFTAIISDNFIELYEMEQLEDGTVKAQLHHEVDSSKKIVLAATNWNPLSSGNIRTYLVVAMDNTLYLYVLDLKAKRLVKKSDVTVKDIRTIGFMSENKLMVMTKANQLVRFDCSTGSFGKKVSQTVTLNEEKDGVVSASFFLGNQTDEQD